MNTFKDEHKTAKTTKEYSTKFKGWEIVIPVGSIVSNKTAMGFDDRYRFWENWRKVAEELTGHKHSILAHDLTYYGINIPAEYCEPYEP